MNLCDLDHEKLRVRPKHNTTKISSIKLNSPTNQMRGGTQLMGSIGPGRSTKFTVSTNTDMVRNESLGMESNDIPHTVPMEEDDSESKPKKYDDRYWVAAFNKYIKKKGPKPGPHPDPEHNWNKHPELYDFGK